MTTRRDVALWDGDWSLVEQLVAHLDAESVDFYDEQDAVELSARLVALTALLPGGDAETIREVRGELQGA
jgi:hypothetical protein